jgi:hypothetical protein
LLSPGFGIARGWVRIDGGELQVVDVMGKIGVEDA